MKCLILYIVKHCFTQTSIKEIFAIINFYFCNIRYCNTCLSDLLALYFFIRKLSSVPRGKLLSFWFWLKRISRINCFVFVMTAWHFAFSWHKYMGINIRDSCSFSLLRDAWVGLCPVRWKLSLNNNPQGLWYFASCLS